MCLTNPPFGSKIPVRGEEKLSQYNLGRKWKRDKESQDWQIGNLKDKEAPQILFIERCLQLLRPGGRMALVLPDGTIGNRQLEYLRDFILGEARLVAVIDVPIETFMPNTSTKTSILVLEKTKSTEADYPIFMAVCETCGHDRRGKATSGDDISEISSKFKEWCEEVGYKFGQLNDN